MFVVDLERAAAVLNGMKIEGHLYWAVSRTVRLGGRDANALVVGCLEHVAS
jgi:hypothetical protein